jgi:hypothetical protein
MIDMVVHSRIGVIVERSSTANRKALGVIGLVVIVIGLAAWSWQSTYGGTEFGGVEIGPDGAAQVYNPDGEVVFEGTEEEAEAFIEDAQGGFGVFLVPGLIIGLGAALIILAVAAPAKAKKPQVE